MAPNTAILPQPKTMRHQTAGASLSSAPSAAIPVPVWGGVECTYNRVGDTYFDQTDLSGHATRQEDFHQIASLGIQTLRFGMTWDRFERDRSWEWADQSMLAMQRAGIRPVAGLLHHGSGPPHTSLLDPAFPVQLAEYAGTVAKRYPVLDAYTPVNEPNTTARFSGQYGLWYPHGRSTRDFLRALINQVKATVLSMAAIRQVRSDAQLIQTDDAGSVSGTGELVATAEVLHARQWLTFDLLCGKVDRSHILFGYMMGHGIEEEEILWFQDHPCPPDVIGMNYYATSDRFLDHRLHLYPPSLRSSEGPFVDVESVRVEGRPPVDFLRPIREAWSRYQRPIALTEVHLGGPPAEQICWLAAAYGAMQTAQGEGVQCAALTAWALLGSYFWNELVTRDNGHYEPGVFDVSSGRPVATPVAEVVAQMAAGRAPRHGALARGGWWTSSDRTCYPWTEIADAPRAA